MTKTEIASAADDWAEKSEKLEKLRAKRERELAPLFERHNEELKPVLAKYEDKIADLKSEIDVIQNAITSALAAKGRAVIITGERGFAVCEIETKTSGRTADVKKFLGFLKSKGETIYDCLTVVLKSAEPLIGKTELDKICEQKTTTQTVVRLGVI